MDKERYLFLDIDGVLNTMNYAMSCQWKFGLDDDEDGALFDPYAIENLRYIVETLPVKLVISSSWRLDGIERMRELWTKRDLPGEIYGVTPVVDKLLFKNLEGGTDTFSVIPYGTRGLEVNEWLRNHPKKQGIPFSYAIIDDGDDYLTIQSGNLVITEPETGLTRELADKILEILR